MSDKREDKPPLPWVLIAVIFALVGVGAYFVKSVLTDDGPQEKRSVAAVTLVRPAPPVMKKEPVEPAKDIQKKEEINETNWVDNEPARADNDSTPAGDDLGVDAVGGAGGDSFGLVGKKGGRSIVAGGSAGGAHGKVSLLTRFAGYAQIVTTEIKKKVIKRLDEEGGIPRGKLQCVVRVRVDSDGKVIDYRITGSSGNTRIDQAVNNALSSCQISEPPPEDMPRTMDIKIISQG